MMDILIKLYVLFNSAVKGLVNYIPQDKEGFLMDLLKQFWNLLIRLSDWTASVLGTDIQKIINIFARFFVRYLSIAFDFLRELVKGLLENL